MKKVFERMKNMSRPASLMLKVCIIVSNVYLAAAIVILIRAGGYSTDTYRLYAMAKELYTAPQAILMVAAVGSVCVEEIATRGN